MRMGGTFVVKCFSNENDCDLLTTLKKDPNDLAKSISGIIIVIFKPLFRTRNTS
jgi:hypothetical protein